MSTSEAKQGIRVHIDWMKRRHMPEVFYIENKSFKFPWQKNDFYRCLRQRNRIGMVAEYEARVLGFMVYELNKTALHILNFVVHPEWRRRGVGKQMVAKLASKLSTQRRNRLTLEVCETNLTAQLFFQANGFKAVNIIRGYYDDIYNTIEDAYLMQYRYKPETLTQREEFQSTIYSPE